MIELLKQKTVLYAEDDMVTRLLYEEYFKLYFKHVYLAENGQQAIELYQEKKPDVVFLDINMPIKSGLEVCQYIRKNDSETKVIMLSVKTDKKTLLHSIELELSSYIEKPLTQTHLKQFLSKLSSKFHESNLILVREFENQKVLWDKANQELIYNSEIIRLTKNEKLFLEFLVTSRHGKVDKHQIFDYIWSDNLNKEFSDASFKALLKRLRDKLPPNTIINQYGLGYRLNK